jgi:hypothetical protein
MKAFIFLDTHLQPGRSFLSLVQCMDEEPCDDCQYNTGYQFQDERIQTDIHPEMSKTGFSDNQQIHEVSL